MFERSTNYFYILLNKTFFNKDFYKLERFITFILQFYEKTFQLDVDFKTYLIITRVTFKKE